MFKIRVDLINIGNILQEVDKENFKSFKNR
jgi:hypothetical protein